ADLDVTLDPVENLLGTDIDVDLDAVVDLDGGLIDAVTSPLTDGDSDLSNLLDGGQLGGDDLALDVNLAEYESLLSTDLDAALDDIFGSGGSDSLLSIDLDLTMDQTDGGDSLSLTGSLDDGNLNLSDLMLVDSGSSTGSIDDSSLLSSVSTLTSDVSGSLGSITTSLSSGKLGGSLFG
ncbi:MAG: hypothetical protein CML29_13725, partial [Rhizobiales bacterium]|nr:hypothetical protein [Hyphomicrobiales bacterium]